MTTRIGLISDVHASPGPLREALTIFHAQGVTHTLCAGDIAGYGNDLETTVALLTEARCQAILGNHEIWHLEKVSADGVDRVSRYFNELSLTHCETIEGKQLYMVHASPPDAYTGGIRLLDEHGDLLAEEKREWSEQLTDFDYDVLIVGHTHQVFAEWLGGTLVINPGSTLLNHSCAVLTLPDMRVEVFALSGRQVLRSWNWSMLVAASPPRDA